MTRKNAQSPAQQEGAAPTQDPESDPSRRFDVRPARGRRAFYGRLEIIRAALLVLGVLAIAMAGYTEWLALQPLPSPTIVLPTLDIPRVSPTPTSTTAEPSAMPTALSLADSGTATAGAALTATPAQTHAPVRTRPPTPRPTPSALLASPAPYPAPTLVEPDDGATPFRRAVFRWQWAGPPLGETRAFDLRIWSDREERSGATRRGAVAPTKEVWVEVNLAQVPAIRDHGPGDYYWTVVVVELRAEGPPQVIGTWGESRRFVYR